ncbi:MULTISPECIES: ABC transporter substrate-binding protein [unclassified Mesorhizobium]|uniref:ABC transporter substrate-binding protein n=1 Tax=unclassified Mesorhizobium TaxID=325217 RepID=UPI000FD4D041|nr:MULTISPECIES: ABC transporter substrate-binding protein [unclassified Mesorhizobium]RVB76386.1 transporter substrate-binding domain-containing protein [Mesorhizobium sp. M6A.T.Cr.TU.014.01.1.1]RWP79791.1 MAG: transporter substrate-binding domain-containing protein [Mesorhizobium sp.]RWQ04469.1 MAG: transporter substrate-binding domain-containing protein [Mesorhizobium sp.]RWQ04674.1 MAG: transporter substrate-binding domain-containing protein [Mesorhizobium sp.]RWQ43007.1 MAG: transporter s
MQISRWIASAATAAMLVISAGSFSAQAQEKLKIATEGAYPPFNTITADGKLVGFDIDIAEALCAQMKVECELVTQDWDGMIPALQARKFDAIVASMSITEERKKQVSFTNKYYTTPLSLVALKDSDIASTEPAALAGKTVGAQASTTQADYAQDVYGKAGAEAKLYPTQEEAVADLMNGRLDAVLSDKFVLMDWMKKSSDGCCKMVGDVKGTETEAGIAVRQEDNALREKLNAAIDAIVADGTYKKIQAKYFDFDIY